MTETRTESVSIGLPDIHFLFALHQLKFVPQGVEKLKYDQFDSPLARALISGGYLSGLRKQAKSVNHCSLGSVYRALGLAGYDIVEALSLKHAVRQPQDLGQIPNRRLPYFVCFRFAHKGSEKSSGESWHGRSRTALAFLEICGKNLWRVQADQETNTVYLDARQSFAEPEHYMMFEDGVICFETPSGSRLSQV